MLTFARLQVSDHQYILLKSDYHFKTIQSYTFLDWTSVQSHEQIHSKIFLHNEQHSHICNQALITFNLRRGHSLLIADFCLNKNQQMKDFFDPQRKKWYFHCWGISFWNLIDFVVNFLVFLLFHKNLLCLVYRFICKENQGESYKEIWCQ